MTEEHPSFSTIEQIRGLVDQLDAYISHYHHGSVEFIAFDGKVVKVHMGGACEECPLSPATLHGWVEGTLRQFFPDIEGVINVPM
jgi:Fe-S cluster biogenesis protein NfuA